MSNSSLVTEALKKRLGAKVTAELLNVIDLYPITNKLRLAHFLAQSCHESQNFTRYSENLNYSQQGLLNTFSKRFNGDKKKAAMLERKPQQIANFVYANRYGNGDEASGDGWKYRARGWIGLTFKDNYIVLMKKVNEDVVSNPDLVSTKYPAASAANFFDVNKIWVICDKGIGADAIKQVTSKINPALDKLDRRTLLTQEFYNLIK